MSNGQPKMSRVWAMPNPCTFDIPDIRALVRTYLAASTVSIDPFARNKRWTTWTNDLNPETRAEFHIDAEEFATMLSVQNVQADLLIFDPPYSVRQVKECYESIGLRMPYERTIGWGSLKDSLASRIISGGVALSFGWNSIGFGIERGFDIEEIMLVCHGRLHNDTICTVERKVINPQMSLL